MNYPRYDDPREPYEEPKPSYSKVTVTTLWHCLKGDYECGITLIRDFSQMKPTYGFSVNGIHYIIRADTMGEAFEELDSAVKRPEAN